MIRAESRRRELLLSLFFHLHVSPLDSEVYISSSLDEMAAANMRCEKNSLALLSSKRTKAFSKSRADEAFALPAFLDASPTYTVESSYRSVIREPKVEHHVNDVETLKQTMLQHESVFKEQLYELHRLYQVQRLLMEESKRTSLFGHPHSDSPPSTSSLPYNLDSCRAKEERRFWEASRLTSTGKQLSGQIDVNRPCEGKHRVDRLGMGKHSQRPIIDLEQPAAEEHTDIRVEEDQKPLAQMLQASWPDSQCTSSLLGKGKHSIMAMHEETSNRVSTLSHSKWSTFEDCFTTQQKEVPVFPLGSSNSKNCSIESGSLPSSYVTTPVTSLFGVKLTPEINNRDVQSRAMQNDSDYKWREPEAAGSDACASRLPHWLLQGLQTSSTTNIPPINLAHQRHHQTSPFFLPKQGERTSSFEERVSSMCAQKERLDICVKSGGLSFGETLLRAPHCKSSPGYFLDPLTGNVQVLHKLAQASSGNESISLLSPSSVEQHLGASLTSATNHLSSPFVVKHSLVSEETEAASAFLFKEMASNSKNSGSPVPPWYQQSASSVMPLVSKAGAQHQRPSSAVGNSSSSWLHVPPVQEGAFTKSTQEAGEASDLDLTLGLDLNDDEAREGLQRVDDSPSDEHLAQRYNRVGLQSEPVRNDFDLNEQSVQVMDAESQTIPTGSKHIIEGCTGSGWVMSTGVRPHLEWQASNNSSSLKAIPEETIASTMARKQQSANSFYQTNRHGDAPDDEQLHGTRVKGGLVAGRSSDGSGLASCESRSTPVPALTKAKDDSALSGEAFPHSFAIRSSQEVIFDSASLVSARRQGLLSAMLSCSEAYQGDTSGGLPLTESIPFKSIYGHTGNDKASNGKVDASEAADILLLLSLDMPSVVSENQHVGGDEERALKWLADSIPQDDLSCMDGGMAGPRVKESILRGPEHCVEDIGMGERVLDAFELAVLSLKPIDPDSETSFPQPIVRCDLPEECFPPSNLRRRSLRRGRGGKDFQKETLPSIASLSRQEITEDLQIIEGLVKSATEAMARCSLSSKEDVSWSLPALSSAKTPVKAKGFRTCKAGKQNGLLRVCSWGESTRRQRMRRQRRVCLPPLGY
ncbi:hypothetical protein GOP47_0029034 [Adiantum capillus-veneris]|nr:hypothetical protein GOP47_0029034 [Adiantum capillus-veneris]